MIVSDKNRYVFVEVPHTGSTAVSRELGRSYDGVYRARKHATYRDFLRTASPEQRRYLAFAAVRNPLDVAVSRYFLMKMKSRRELGDPAFVARHGSVAQKMDYRIEQWVERTDADFERFLLTWYRLPFDSWTSLDKDRYGKVLRFESLDTDFGEVLTMIGLERAGPLPVANETPGRERDFISYYTPKAMKRAIWVFGPYMEEWGYSFPREWANARVPLWSKVLLRLVRVFRSVYWNYARHRNPRRPSQLTDGGFA